MRDVRALVAALALFAASGPAPLFGQVAEDREVVQIAFEGNQAFSNKELRAAILTEQTHCRTFLFEFPLPFCPLTDWGFAHVREYLDETELPLDLLRMRLYYRQRGYREAKVDTLVQRGDRTVRIRFRVDEGEPTRIRSLAISGLEAVLDTARVRRSLPLREGDPLDLVALGRGESFITDRLRRRGYVDATVLREYFIPRDSHEAEVALRVVPGPRVRIGNVTVNGSGDVGDKVVRELLQFERGEYFNEDRILDSQRSLYNLEALRWANISTVRRSETDTLVDLRVDVAPAPSRALRTGLGVETTECVQVLAEYKNRNFLKQARVLRIDGRLSNIFAGQLEGRFPCTDVSSEKVFQDLNYHVELGFEQPVFSAGRNTLGASVYLERETVPDLYVRTALGGRISLARRVLPRMHVNFSYRPELTAFAEESADIYFCVNFGICTPEDIDTLSEPLWLSPLGALWTWDRTDARFAATRGYYLASGVEAAGPITLSDYEYVRGTLDAAHFEQFGGNAVVGIHLRLGAVTPTGAVFEESTEDVIHPTKRFFAGGPQSVRGFGLNLLGPTVLVLDAEDDCGELDPEVCAPQLSPPDLDERPIGGNAVLEGSLELRLSLGSRWTAAGFLDFGQVWKDLSTREALVFTPGLGFRFRSPVGPFRVDFGYNTSSPTEKGVVAVLPDGSIEELETRVLWDPFTYDDPSLLKEVFRRLQLQLSIGEAF